MMFKRTKLAAAAVAALAMATSACEQDPMGRGSDLAPGVAAFDSTFASNPNRRFVQIERHANPLAIEAFVEKREHSAYDTYPAIQDPRHFTDDVVHFVTTVARRDQAYARTIAGALFGTETTDPGDKIRVFTTRAAGVTAANMASNTATVGWLTHALNPGNGYGGRTVAEDATDKALGATFGNALGNTTNVSPGLVTDNVNSNDKPALTTFPYLPEPTL